MRYKPIQTRGGAIVQSGLDVRQHGDQLNPVTPKLGLYRGLVLNTYVPRTESGDLGNVRRGNQVECDVLLIRSHSIVQRAPVMQRAFGVNEAHGPWIPKAATRTLDGSKLNFKVKAEDGSFEAPATSFDNTDGDMVIVQFVEGNPDYPIIMGALTHERTNRLVRATSNSKLGWSEGENDRGTPYQDEYYVHHQGTEIRINGRGDALIDTVGAYQDRSTEDNSAAGGEVRIRVKEGQRLTIALGSDADTLEVYKDGAQLRIDLGENASERVILGDSFLQFFNTFMNVFNNHVHAYTDTGAVPSAALTAGPFPTGQSMTDTLLSDLAKTKKT